MRSRCRRRRPSYQRALITGASRGIGAAFIDQMPPSTEIVLTGRDADALETQKVRATERGLSVETVVADLSNPHDRTSLMEATGPIDLLIANAGLGHFDAFLDRSIEDHRQVIDVNITAVVELVHGLLPGMVERAETTDTRAGIMMMGSTVGFVPVPRLGVYAASKAFILSFSEALAAELSRKPVDIVCVCPGATDTGFGRAAGFSGGRMPGAQTPDVVAAEALEALVKGRRVSIIDPLPAPVLTPGVLARSLFAEVVGRGMDFRFGRGRT